MPISGGVGIGAPPGQVRAGYGKQTGVTGPPKPNFGSGINWNKFVPKGARGPYVPQQGAAVVNAPPVATVPGASTSTTPDAPQPPAPSPYDATYFADLNNATLGANAKIGQYTSDIANSRTSLQNTLDQLGYQQGLATTRAQDAENARGGFAQGALGNTLGQLNRAYQDQGSSAALSAGQQQAAWEAAITAAQQGLGGTQLALAAASAARQVAILAKDPSAGEPTGGSSGSSAGGASAATAGPPTAGAPTAQASSSTGGGRSGKPVFASTPAAQALARALANRAKSGRSGRPAAASGGAGY